MADEREANPENSTEAGAEATRPGIGPVCTTTGATRAKSSVSRQMRVNGKSESAITTGFHPSGFLAEPRGWLTRMITLVVPAGFIPAICLTWGISTTKVPPLKSPEETAVRATLAVALRCLLRYIRIGGPRRFPFISIDSSFKGKQIEPARTRLSDSDWAPPIRPGSLASTPVPNPNPQREVPRLCRGGSKSLTDTGVHRKLPIVSRQAHEREFHDGRCRKPKSCKMGVQVSCSVHTQIPKEGAVC